MIKHVSFDVWNTIVKPNPEFASTRTKLIAIALNLDPDYVKTAYTKVKRFVDGCAENSDGAAFTTDEVYKLLFSSLHVPVSPGLAREIRETVDELFKRFPPIIVPSVVTLFDYLRKQGITASIGSNSNFISGTVMHPYLQSVLGERAAGDAYLFGVYSDLVVTAKPSKLFFDAVAFKTNVYRDDSVARAEILHVGDNEICDVEGARRAGMHSLLIGSPDLLCEQVKLRIECENEFGVSFSHHLNTVE
jgi:putative hydrolase of the HAD superfamily